MGAKDGRMATIRHTDLGPRKWKQNKNNSASPNSLFKILLCFSEYSVRDCGKKQRWFPKTTLLQGMWQVKAWKEKQQERAFNLKRYPYFKEKKMKVIWHLYLGSWQSSQSKKKEMSELLRLQVNPNQLSHFQILQIFFHFPYKTPWALKPISNRKQNIRWREMVGWHLRTRQQQRAHFEAKGPRTKLLFSKSRSITSHICTNLHLYPLFITLHLAWYLRHPTNITVFNLHHCFQQCFQ